MKTALFRTYTLSLISCMLFLASMPALGEDYDPLTISSQVKHSTMDMTVHDKMKSREIPIRVYLPAVASSSPVILYSHGLGGSREGSSYLGEHWASRGYTVVYLQHPGSDTSVWKNIPEWRRLKRLKAMKSAGNAQNFLLRVKDVTAVLNQLEIWNKTESHGLEGRLNLKKVGMSGHSFGARTTQAVCGQKFEGEYTQFTEERIIAALPMSPSSPSDGTAKDAFGKVSVPWMLMTGTKDTAPFGNNSDAKSRLAVFPALPLGGKYELVLFEAEHSAFTDQALMRRSEPRNPNHHRSILALSTAFWDTYLREDNAAKDWLHGEGPRSVLEMRDVWQKK